jgi:hypothetical protein
MYRCRHDLLRYVMLAHATAYRGRKPSFDASSVVQALRAARMMNVSEIARNVRLQRAMLANWGP